MDSAHGLNKILVKGAASEEPAAAGLYERGDIGIDFAGNANGRPGVPLDRQPPPDGTFNEIDLVSVQFTSINCDRETSRSALHHSYDDLAGG